VVILPIALVFCSVNHRAPSGPAVIYETPAGYGPLSLIGYTVTIPVVVILVILVSDAAHNAPSRPLVIHCML